MCYSSRGDGVAKKAKGHLEGAIELDPKYAAAYFHRGIAKQGKGI
jgi:hypothetical protein